MSLNGVLQLKKLTVFYSAWGGSSAEAKELLASKQWAEFKAANPQIEFEAVAKRNVHPYFQAEYHHGGKKTVSVRRESALDILERAQALRDSRGLKAKTWVERHRHVKKTISIQGQWNPFFEFGGEPEPLRAFEPVPELYPRPKYGVAKRKTQSMDARFQDVGDFRSYSAQKRAARENHFKGIRPSSSPSL